MWLTTSSRTNMKSEKMIVKNVPVLEKVPTRQYTQPLLLTNPTDQVDTDRRMIKKHREAMKGSKHHETSHKGLSNTL